MKQSFQARVINVQKGSWVLSDGEKTGPARLSGRLNRQMPVVGDWVSAETDEFGSWTIVEIAPRKSVFVRPNRGGHADGFVKTVLEEPVVANFDYVFIISSLNRNFNPGRIARFAAITISGGGIPVAVLTKADLCDDIPQKVQTLRALCGTMEIYPISSFTGQGIEELRALMKPGTTVALLGSSGVGKSTLVNTLAGREIMAVSHIREGDDKGRHTTTSRQLIEVGGVSYIDTPGMRELGMCDVEEGIQDTFPDIAELEAQCRFSDCRHSSEPGCAVRAALQNGSLSSERWEVYQRMRRESDRAGHMKLQVQVARARKAIRKH